MKGVLTFDDCSVPMNQFKVAPTLCIRMFKAILLGCSHIAKNFGRCECFYTNTKKNIYSFCFRFPLLRSTISSR